MNTLWFIHRILSVIIYTGTELFGISIEDQRETAKEGICFVY